MDAAAETELARIWTKVDKIRAKQAAKPKHSPLPEHPALSRPQADDGWRPLTFDDEKMTCPMPADETIVEVMLRKGEVCRAFYACDIIDAGDWDFTRVDADDEPDDDPDDSESIAGDVVAWRPLPSAPATGGGE